MATTSWKSAGTAESVTGVGTLQWFADDAGTALSGSEVSSDNGVYAGIFGTASAVSNYLRATNFGFTNSDVPIGSSIDGFEIEVVQFRNGSPVTSSTLIKLVKGLSVVGSDFGVSGDWATSETTVTYGSSTELGGTSWTQSDVVSSNLGMVLSVTLGSGFALIDRVQLVEQIRMRIHYTVGAGFDAKTASSFLQFFV